MNKSVACCYLTYNHPETMDEVLGKICPSYISRGIDIYVFDSSDNENTFNIVKKYEKEYSQGLYYVNVDFISSGDAKYLYVLKESGLSEKYDYIWPTKDRCYFSGETLDAIVAALETEPDVVLAADERDRYEFYIPDYCDEYSDNVTFFAHYGNLTCNWEALIRKSETMIRPIDWSKYENLYKTDDSNNFNQTLTLFARLSELPDPRIKIVHVIPGEKSYSDKSESMWKKDIVKIWVDKWVSAVFSLPAEYDGYKQHIIKDQLGHPSLFGTIDSLIVLRNSGILTREVFDALLPVWGMLSRIPVDTASDIMNGKDTQVFANNKEQFFEAFRQRDFEKAYYSFVQNRWMESEFSQYQYTALKVSFEILINDIRKNKSSLLFDGVDSFDKLMGNYGYYSS